MFAHHSPLIESVYSVGRKQRHVLVLQKNINIRLLCTSESVRACLEYLAYEDVTRNKEKGKGNTTMTDSKNDDDADNKIKKFYIG